jgi:predicted dehydrogenase
VSYQRAYEQHLRIGVVGLGGHTYRNLLPALHFLPVRLCAICDSDKAVLNKTAVEYGGCDCFDDASKMFRTAELDAVMIAVGAAQHPALVHDALRCGLHAWVEKPPALRAHEIERLLEARGDRVCAVGFKKTYMPATRKAEALLGADSFGTLRKIIGLYQTTIPRDGEGALASATESSWLAGGCHPLSAMLQLAGPAEALLTLRDPNGPGGTVWFQFASGATGVLHAIAGASSGFVRERYELYGDARSIVIDDCTRVILRRGIPFDYETTRDYTSNEAETGDAVWEPRHSLATLENKALFVQGIFDELLDFCEAILESRPLRTANLEFTLHLMRVYEASLLSEGELVSVEPGPNS